MVANAGISCLESTLGYYLEHTLNMSTSYVGFMMLVGAVPSVIGSKISGDLGIAYGRWKVILVGMMIEGFFFALFPKDMMLVQVISLAGLGAGMGIVDGCAPAMLGQLSTLFHDGTGVVFTLSSSATQLGFFLGPPLGSAVLQATNFEIMGIVFGTAIFLYGPVLLINKNIPGIGDTKSLEMPGSDNEVVAVHVNVPAEKRSDEGSTVVPEMQLMDKDLEAQRHLQNLKAEASATILV